MTSAVTTIDIRWVGAAIRAAVELEAVGLTHEASRVRQVAHVDREHCAVVLELAETALMTARQVVQALAVARLPAVDRALETCRAAIRAAGGQVWAERMRDPELDRPTIPFDTGSFIAEAE